MSGIHEIFFKTQKRLIAFIEHTDLTDSDDVSRTLGYLEWIDKKTKLIQNENDIIVPQTFLPTKITNYQYGKLNPDEQTYIRGFYRRIKQSDDFLTLDGTLTISNEDCLNLAKILVLIRGYVVWVEFGFNIGKEFGGKHPALILRVAGDNLIVVPLSSQTPDPIKDYHVKVDKVYRFQPMTRWINIHRIRPIDLKRIDFTSTYGTVKGTVLNSISSAIQVAGVR